MSTSNLDSPLLYQVDGPIAWVTFNDPERLNALSEAMGRELEKLVPRMNKNKAIRAVILSGSGRAFSAGGHLDIIMARTKKTPAINRKEMLSFYNRFLSILKIKVPVIAMINGPAIGAAFCLSLACDFRLASSTAKMGVNFVKIGLSPGMGGTFLLPVVLGIPLATELLLTGKTLSSEEALHKGVVHRVFPEESLREETVKLAMTIASNAPLAVQTAKEGILLHLQQLQKSLQFESRGQAVCFKTQDIVEGIEAIRGKRSPTFKGR